MNKLQKVIIGFGIVGAVGISYVITALKGLPDAFDFTLEENEDDREI